MKKKGKLLRSLAVLLLVMVCAALNPKIAKAAGENITMKNAKTIKIGEEIDEKYSANDIKHSCKYYKFKVPTDIGNKWIDFKLRNNSDIWCAMNLYNDHEEELATDRINGNSTGKIHLSVKDSEHNDDVVKLTPGQTYYLEVGVLEWDDDYSRDFELSSSTVADDNWGSIEKAPEIKFAKLAISKAKLLPEAAETEKSTPTTVRIPSFEPKTPARTLFNFSSIVIVCFFITNLLV